MLPILIVLLFVTILALTMVLNKETFNANSSTDLIVVYPHEIINSNFKVFKNRTPIESHFPDRYILARMDVSPDTLIKECILKGSHCSMIIQNDLQKELWAYNQYYPILLEYRQDYTTYIGEKPKIIKIDLPQFEQNAGVQYKVYKDFAPKYAILGTQGVISSGIDAAKKWCQQPARDNELGVPCQNIVHNKKTGFIMTNQPWSHGILYSSPGFDTYVPN